MQWFKNRIDAKILIEEFRRQFNEVRPHSSLGNLTPAEFKLRLLTTNPRARVDGRIEKPDIFVQSDPESARHDALATQGQSIYSGRRLNRPNSEFFCSQTLGAPEPARFHQSDTKLPCLSTRAVHSR